MKVHITIECENKPNPGNLEHLIALLQNPASRNNITIEYEEDEAE